MQEGGALTNTFGWLVGVGPGAGFGLLIFLCGIGGVLVGLSGHLVKNIRNLDTQFPDYHLPEPDNLLRQPQPVYISSEASREQDLRTSSPDSNTEVISENEET
jgi:hypothetical protein